MTERLSLDMERPDGQGAYDKAEHGYYYHVEDDGHTVAEDLHAECCHTFGSQHCLPHGVDPVNERVGCSAVPTLQGLTLLGRVRRIIPSVSGVVE